ASIRFYQRLILVFQCFYVCRFGENRIRNRLVVFDGFVTDATSLLARYVMINYPGSRNAINLDWFCEPILFNAFLQFTGVGILMLAQINNLRRQTILCAEFVLNPESIRIG